MLQYPDSLSASSAISADDICTNDHGLHAEGNGGLLCWRDLGTQTPDELWLSDLYVKLLRQPMFEAENMLCSAKECVPLREADSSLMNYCQSGGNII